MNKEIHKTDSVCPLCLTKLGSMVAHHCPKVGDFSVCGHCGVALRITNNFSVRRLDSEDVSDLGGQPHILCSILSIQRKIRERQQFG